MCQLPALTGSHVLLYISWLGSSALFKVPLSHIGHFIIPVILELSG